MSNVEYAIIIKNKTRLESLIEHFNTKAQAKFYIERTGGNFEDYELEHETFHHSLNSFRTQLSRVIKYKKKLLIESLMPENGVIFSDGIEKDFLKFNSGSIVTIGIAEETAKIVINNSKHVIK